MVYFNKIHCELQMALYLQMDFKLNIIKSEIYNC